MTLTFAQRRLTAAMLPEMQARCKGEDPKLSGFCGLKPELISICIRPGKPLYAAQWRAESPFMSVR